jgi:hypothetical protein
MQWNTPPNGSGFGLRARYGASLRLQQAFSSADNQPAVCLSLTSRRTAKQEEDHGDESRSY